jgi:hypothetical protein
MSLTAIAQRQTAETAIARAAEATGVDFQLLMETARRESSFNPRAKAPTSSASGLFQFIEQTWLDVVRRHGAKHGLADLAGRIETRNGRAIVSDGAQRQAILDLRFNPEIAARMAGELALENAERLADRLGRAPKPGEIYAAHVMGAAGAARLIEAGDRGAPDASALFPREAGANRWLFFDRAGAALSAQGLLNKLDVTASAVRGASAPGAAAQAPAPLLRGQAHDPALLAAFIELLFASSGLSLFEDAPEQENPLRALSAYRKWDQT